MTIPTEIAVNRYLGDDVTKDFYFNFKVEKAAHLVVKIANSADTEKRTLILTTHYFITGLGKEGGGYITTTDLSGTEAESVILPTGWNINIRRIVPLTQDTDLQNQGALVAEVIEHSLDTSTVQTQQLNEQIYRCVKVSDTSGGSGDDFFEIVQDYIDEAEAARDGAEEAEDGAEDARDLAERYSNDTKVNYEQQVAVDGQTFIETPFILNTNLNSIMCNVNGLKLPTSLLTRTSDYILTFGSEIPVDATCGANFRLEKIDLDFAGGNPSGTPYGGASTLGGRLALVYDDTRYVDYDAQLNANWAQQLTVRFTLIPNYDGTHAFNQYFFDISQAPGNVNNSVLIYHQTLTGSLILGVLNSSGSGIVAADLGVWNPVKGASYEFELNIDIDIGKTDLFINGARKGSTLTATGTRSDTSTLLRIGASGYAPTRSDFYIDNFIVFDSVQHTDPYTPENIFPSELHAGDLIEVRSLEFNPDATGDAAASAAAALASASAAGTSETNSKTSETNAGTSAEDAETAAEAAVPAAATAVAAKNTAVEAKDLAVAAKNLAVPAATAAVDAKNLAVPAAATAVTAKDDAVEAAEAAVPAAVAAVAAKVTAVEAKDDAVEAAEAAVPAAEAAVTAAGNASDSAGESAESAIISQSWAASGMYVNIKDILTSYSITEIPDQGNLLRVDSDIGIITMSLPSITTLSNDFRVAIIKWSADANRVLVKPVIGDTINGSSEDYMLETHYKSAIFAAKKLPGTTDWVALSGYPAIGNIVVDVFSGDDIETDFILSEDPGNEENVRIHIRNGSKEYVFKDEYTVTGTILSFNVAPLTGTDNIEAFYGSVVSIGTPADNTVSTAKLQDEAVTNGKIGAEAVSTAKLQDDAVSTAKLQEGAVTGGTVAIDHSKIAENTIKAVNLVNNTITLAKMGPVSVGTSQLVDVSIDQDKLGPLAVTEFKIGHLAVKEGKIGALAVTNAKIGPLAVTESKIWPLAVTESKIWPLAVTNAKIGALAVTEDKVGALAVTEPKIGPLAVTEDKIGALAVTNAKIGALAVTNAKIGALAVTEDKIGPLAVTEDKIAVDAVTTTKIYGGAVTTNKIANDAVTGFKIINNAITEDKIAVDAITTTKIAVDAVTNAKIATDAITNVKIDDEAVTAPKIEHGAVTTVKISTYAVTEPKIANGAVTNAKIFNGAVTNTKIYDGAVSTNKIANAAVTTDKIDNLDVTNAKIASNAVTSNKIANNAVIADKIPNNSITGLKIADYTVDQVNIATGAITTVKIADLAIIGNKIGIKVILSYNIADGAIDQYNLGIGAVTNAKIFNGAVTTDKIADGAVTTPKLSSAVESVKMELNGTFVLTAGVLTKVLFDKVIFNTLGQYNPITGDFTSTVNGSLYIVIADLKHLGTTGSKTCYNQIRKNGVIYANAEFTVNASSITFNSGISCFVPLDAGDTLSVHTLQSTGANGYAIVADPLTSFNIHRIR